MFAGPVPGSLPGQLTSFVGRAGELAEADELLSRVRLLTITGAGGSGKTRLAVRLAADSAPRQPRALDPASYREVVEHPKLVEAVDLPAALERVQGGPDPGFISGSCSR